MAIKIDLREDGSLYPEGYTIGDAIELGISKSTWLIPGITFQRKELSEAGTVVIPVVKEGTKKGTRTNLCEDGVSGSVDTDQINVSIDGKYTAEMDGCFTVAGIADTSIERAINTAKLRILANEIQKDFSEVLTTGATLSTAVLGEQKPSEFLDDMIDEFTLRTGMAPTIIKCNPSFYKMLKSELKTFQTVQGAEAFVTGVLGRVNGLLVLRDATQEKNVIMWNTESLIEAVPTTIKQVPNATMGVNPIGGVDTVETVSFDKGLVSVFDLAAKSFVGKTYVHKFNGRVCVPGLASISAE